MQVRFDAGGVTIVPSKREVKILQEASKLVAFIARTVPDDTLLGDEASTATDPMRETAQIVTAIRLRHEKKTDGEETREELEADMRGFSPTTVGSN